MPVCWTEPALPPATTATPRYVHMYVHVHVRMSVHAHVRMYMYVCHTKVLYTYMHMTNLKKSV